MLLKRFWLSFLALLLLACGSQDHDNTNIQSSSAESIVGGMRITQTSALSSYLVQIQSFNNGDMSGICSGVVIASDVVLTAAHCFGDEQNLTVAVLFGSEGEHFRERRYASAVIIHERYNTSGFPKLHDLALVKFRGALPVGAHVARLFQTDLRVGSVVSALGYGATQYQTQYATEPLLLRAANLRVESFDRDSNQIRMTMSASNGVARGDSGGPLLMRLSDGTIATAGVMSSISGNFEYATATMVTTHISWIQQKIPELRRLAGQ